MNAHKPRQRGRGVATGGDAVRPKKALGQHFLLDLDVARRIAATLDDWTALPVMEVGPGMGVLTQYLASEGRDVKVVEIDKESVEYLRQHYPALDGRIVEGDFLELDLDTVFTGTEKYCVIGNYPYNISTQIFFHVLDYRDRVVCCSGMLQKEVAERLAAPAGARAGGVLSVLLHTWYDVEYLFTVPPEAFNPPPKVQSGVIRMTRNSRTSLPVDEGAYRRVIKTAFMQRRKTLRNSMKSMISDRQLPPDVEALMSLRPEQLTIDQFIALTEALSLKP